MMAKAAATDAVMDARFGKSSIELAEAHWTG
jgi:hypothetical protein